jgi:hypothetical protein
VVSAGLVHGLDEADVVQKIVNLLKRKKKQKVSMDPAKVGSQHYAPGRQYPGGPRPLPDHIELEVAPPGKEDMVKALKKEKDVDNPWAVAWSAHNKDK